MDPKAKRQERHLLSLSLELRAPEIWKRREAVKGLLDLDPLPESFGSALAVALCDPDMAVRLSAAKALRRLGSAAGEHLAKVLRDSTSTSGRIYALCVLGQHRELSKEAEQALWQAAHRDVIPEIRREALMLLRQRGLES